jgi:hypothetical protein
VVSIILFLATLLAYLATRIAVACHLRTKQEAVSIPNERVLQIRNSLPATNGDVLVNLAPASTKSRRSDLPYVSSTTYGNPSSRRDPMLYFFSEERQPAFTFDESSVNFGPELDDDGFTLHNVQLT